MSLLTYIVESGELNKAPWVLMGIFLIVLTKAVSNAKYSKSIILKEVKFIFKATVLYFLGKYILFPFLYAVLPVSTLPVEVASNYCELILLVLLGVHAFKVYNRVLPCVKSWYYLTPLISIFASKILF